MNDSPITIGDFTVVKSPAGSRYEVQHIPTGLVLARDFKREDIAVSFAQSMDVRKDSVDYNALSEIKAIRERLRIADLLSEDDPVVAEALISACDLVSAIRSGFWDEASTALGQVASALKRIEEYDRDVS